MAQRTCTRSGCENPHRARGLCSMHWKQEYGKRTKYTITCIVCQREHQSDRRDGKFCSDECRSAEYQQRDWSHLPRQGGKPWSRIRKLLIKQDKAARGSQGRLWVAGPCTFCGSAYVTLVHGDDALYCSDRCQRRAAAIRRRGRERAALGTYTWAEVMHLFLLFDKQCAYCCTPIEGRPDPDHVVPLSKGGANSITNILPSCQLCNSDKRDLLLHEWAADRARRNLPPVTTTWVRGDSRYQHLAVLQEHEHVA